MPRGPGSPAQQLAQRRNWFTRCLRGSLGTLSNFAETLSEDDASDLDVALTALRRMDERRRTTTPNDTTEIE